MLQMGIYYLQYVDIEDISQKNIGMPICQLGISYIWDIPDYEYYRVDE